MSEKPGSRKIEANDPAPGRAAVHEAPPILGRWSRIYAAVMLYLACLLLILLLITRAFQY